MRTLALTLALTLAFVPTCIPGPQPTSELVDTPAYNTPEQNPVTHWEARS